MTIAYEISTDPETLNTFLVDFQNLNINVCKNLRSRL